MKHIGKILLGLASFGALSGQRALAEPPVANFGAGSSGGGFLITDQENPWWVQNTSEVHYCISIDKEGFKLDRKLAEKHIAAAFGYWKRSFDFFVKKPTIFPGLESPNNSVFVATQNFILKSCQEPVDLVFQLGYITDDQRNNLPDLQSVLSVAMRTSYERKNLHGKGYIYATPTQGPEKFKGFELTYDPWTVGNGAFFYLAMVHELGHVFGLQHNVDSPSGIMGTKAVHFLFTLPEAMAEPIAEDLAAYIDQGKMDEFFRVTKRDDLLICTGLSKQGVYNFKNSYFGVKSTANHSPSTKIFNRVFGLNSDKDLCTQVTLENLTLRVYGGTDRDSLTLKGEAKMSPVHPWGDDLGESLVHLWIPPEHKDFFRITDPIFNHFPAAFEWSQELKGEFQVFENGQRTPIAFVLEKLKPFSLTERISAIVDGQLISNISSGN